MSAAHAASSRRGTGPVLCWQDVRLEIREDLRTLFVDDLVDLPAHPVTDSTLWLRPVLDFHRVAPITVGYVTPIGSPSNSVGYITAPVT
jgi:hypothetical protein